MDSDDFSLNNNSQTIVSSLTDEKRRFIEKHSLMLAENMIWVTLKENAFPRKICRHRFMEKSDMVGLLFRINEICFAKVNYFRINISSFEPLRYDYKKGFIETDLWDADFLRHKASGYIIDFRYLNTIKEIEKFRDFCGMLEGYECQMLREE